MYDKNQEKIIMDLLIEVRARQKKLKGFSSFIYLDSFIKTEYKDKDSKERNKLSNSINRQINKEFKAHLLLKDENAKDTLREHIYSLDKVIGHKKATNFAFIAVLSILIIGIYYFVPSTSDKAEEKRVERESNRLGSKYGAWAYAKIYVEKNLKNPSSADFPFGGAEGVRHLGNGVYSFSSYVDAQNGFGATVRKNFSGEIKRVNGGWEVVSFNFN